MSRVNGTFELHANYDITVRKPLDARILVPSYEDLFIPSNWVKKGSKQVIAFNGMVVSVANTADTSNNGLYFLFDPDCDSPLKSPDVTRASNWIKIGSVGGCSQEIEELQTAVSSINDRIDQIENVDIICINGGAASK